VCCRVLQCVVMHDYGKMNLPKHVLQVCCRVLQGVAGVLQGVAVCCDA